MKSVSIICRKFSFLILILWCSFQSSAQKLNIEKRLLDLPNVTLEKIESSNNTSVIFRLKVRQPIDHSNPEKGHFFQKVYLTHTGYDNPTVLITQGYEMKKNRKHEIAKLLNANQVNVEHRFFGESKPDSLNYTYLNLKQATSDLHHIRTLFNDLYPEKWISTGVSKGGSTTIFYNFFYPGDVDASISYVAPFTNAFEDKRIYKFLDSIGTKECREKIKKLQFRLLKNREKIIPLLKLYSEKVGWEFTYLSIEEAFEYSILEFPFTFWQWGHNCDKIPDEKSNLKDLVAYFIGIDSLSLFNDKLIEKYGPHYYQAATEMGYYGYQIEDFKNLLLSLPTDINPHAALVPNKMKVSFDSKLLKEVNNWIQTQANHIIFIYGANDTWTSCAIPENDNIDAEWFFMEGKHHGNARIRYMNDSNYKRLCSTLERWLSLKIENTLPVKK